MSEKAIPQYDLRNDKGQPVPFHFIEWGTGEGYNAEKAHRHNFNEILFFKKGGGTHDIDFTTYKPNQGSVHFVASENVHLMMRGKDTTGYSLLFTRDYFPAAFTDSLPFSKVQPVMHLSKADFAHVNRMAAMIKAEYEAAAPLHEQLIRSYLNALLLHMQRIYSETGVGIERGNLPPHVGSFMQLVKQHFAENNTVEHYASQLHISAKHLIELCKKHTGKTPLQHIKDCRIAEAKRLLYNTQLSVKEVAYQLNFDEPANFSKYFKAETGYTPATYRKESGK